MKRKSNSKQIRLIVAKVSKSKTSPQTIEEFFLEEIAKMQSKIKPGVFRKENQKVLKT